MDAPTFQDIRRIARDEILAGNSALTREIVDRDGTDANILVAAMAAVGDEVIGQLSIAAAGTYLDTARRVALDRLVFDRYGIVRKVSSPALGVVQFTTTAPSAASFSIPVGTLLSTADGRQFVTTTSVVYPIASSGPIEAQVRSVLAGISQQATADTITSIVSPISGAPSDIAVNNSDATAGADDEEQDEALRARARSFFVNAQRGTRSAIEYAARSVAGVRKAVAFETLDALGRPGGSVQVVITDAFTEALVNTSPTPPTYATQARALALNVSTALDSWRGFGIYVDVQTAIVTLQGVTLLLSFSAGVDTEAVALAARAITVAYVNNLNPGQAFSRSDLVDALRAVRGLIITGNEVYAPSGDVTPLPLEALRTSLTLVTVG